MSGRRRQQLSPTLFPFLAVLVCTLGTLILFLALVAENATTAAAQESKTDPAPPPEDQLTAAAVESMITEADFRATELVAFRDQQVADIGQRRDQLTHLDDHINRLSEQLKQLNEEIEIAIGAKQADQVDPEKLVQLKQLLAAELQQVTNLRAERENQSPRFVIVPHKGPNGTDRRPVYLECTANGLTIWPEGVQLSMVNLEDTFSDANPLDAALRVIRHHAMKNYGDTIAPYPLLVVRPDGVKSYAAARRAMREWDDQFGYELVPAGVKLAYDNADPALKQRVEDVVRQEIIKQHGRQKLAARLRGGGGGRSGERFPTLSAASMDRRGRASGFEDHRDGKLSGNPYAPGSFDRSQPYAGTGADAASELDQYLRDVASDYAGSNSGTDGIRESIGDLSPGSGGKTALDALGGSAGDFNSQPGTDPRQGQGAKSFADLGPGERGETYSLSDATEKSEQQRSNPFYSNLPPSQGTSSQQTQSQSTHGTQSGASNNLSPGPAPNAMSSGSSQAPPTSPSMAGTTPGQPPTSMQNQPPPSVNSSQPKVRRQGTDWALPKSVAVSHGTAIVRTIRVKCYPDRFELLPPRTGGRLEFFGFSDGDIHRATMELATAIRDRIVRWGAALPGGRWQPRLDVEIMPRGDQRFHQLRMLMTGSGVDVEGRRVP